VIKKGGKNWETASQDCKKVEGGQKNKVVPVLVKKKKKRSRGPLSPGGEGSTKRFSFGRRERKRCKKLVKTRE